MSGGAKCSPQSSSACSSAARTSSSPRKSARANGPGIMPVPIIIPRSTSRTPAMPSSSTRHASTNAFSWKRSASLASMLIEALPCLGAEVAVLDERLHALVDVEAVAVGVAHVARDLHDRVEAAHVGDAERAHGHVHGLGDVGVQLGRVDARLVLVAPDLARGGRQDAVDDEARALGGADRG